MQGCNPSAHRCKGRKSNTITPGAVKSPGVFSVLPSNALCPKRKIHTLPQPQNKTVCHRFSLDIH